MTVDDVPYHIQQEETPDTRLTLQHFEHMSRAVDLMAPHNTDARQPEDPDQFPPAMIFDFLYGCTVLRRWASPEFKDFIRMRSKDFYYDTPAQHPLDERQKRIQEQTVARAAARAQRREHSNQISRSGDIEASEAMDLIMALWMRSAKKHPRRQEGGGERASQERVEAWLKSVTPS